MLSIVLPFLASLLLFVAIGILSATRRKTTTEDYLVAGRSVSPWLTALSSVATNNSGFMFVGLVGYTYRDGIESMWMMIGWLFGDLLAWMWIHRRIREHSGQLRANSMPALLGRDHQGKNQRAVVVLAGLLTLAFLGIYAAAQLKAGSVALHSLFGWTPAIGAVLGAAIVVAYCFSGGLRASIWTDAAQSIVMFVAMLALVVAAAREVGGPVSLYRVLEDIDAQSGTALSAILPGDLRLGFAAYFLGMVAGGFGAIGQPHIVIRSMAIASPADIARARVIYFAWFVPFFLLAIAVGLYARVILPELASMPAGLSAADAQSAVVHASERALPELARTLLPGFLVGVVIAGLFAATMSTADSQVLACSAAFTQDLRPKLRHSYGAAKIATMVIAMVALVIALFAGSGVFSLVLVAWSALGASLGPVLVLRVFRLPAAQGLVLTMMLGGLGTVIAWQLAGLDGAVFKILPGLLVAFALYGGARLLGMHESRVDDRGVSAENDFGATH